MRRELFETVGPWRAGRECYCAPSQDFLFRAWKAGKDLRFIPTLTVLALPSGVRENSYRDNPTYEHEYFAEQMGTNPRFREQVLTHAAIHLYNLPTIPYLTLRLGQIPGLLVSLLRRFLFILLYKPILWWGWNPNDLALFARYGRRGSFIRALRRKRGLE